MTFHCATGALLQQINRLRSSNNFAIVAKSFNWPESAFRQISVLQPTASRGRATLSPTGLYLRLSFSRPSSGFFAVAAIPAARSFAIRSMSFTGTGLVRGNWTVPFRSS